MDLDALEILRAHRGRERGDESNVALSVYNKKKRERERKGEPRELIIIFRACPSGFWFNRCNKPVSPRITVQRRHVR